MCIRDRRFLVRACDRPGRCPLACRLVVFCSRDTHLAVPDAALAVALPGVVLVSLARVAHEIESDRSAPRSHGRAGIRYVSPVGVCDDLLCGGMRRFGG